MNEEPKYQNSEPTSRIRREWGDREEMQSKKATVRKRLRSLKIRRFILVR